MAVGELKGLEGFFMKKVEEYQLVLKESFEKIGLKLNEQQMEQFLIYYEYLIEKNEVMNLTAITEYEEVVLKHFVDSVSLIKVIDLEKVNTLIDVGTGAGFPGIPLKIVFPHLKVVLLDSLNKRILFLNELIDKLRFENITAIHARAEDAARKREYREQFDLCVSRAVANLSSLSEYCLPFVRVGGIFISYKSGDVGEEILNARKAITILGGKEKTVLKFTLPGTEIKRSLVVIKKKKGTGKKFPRRAGLPTKEPIH